MNKFWKAQSKTVKFNCVDSQERNDRLNNIMINRESYKSAHIFLIATLNSKTIV